MLKLLRGLGKLLVLNEDNVRLSKRRVSSLFTLKGHPLRV